MTLKIGQIGRAPHLPTQVADLMAKEIMDGRLKSGDRIPTEHKLAETFGVSRNVVREAISRLKADGIIQSRQGVGAFVAGLEQRTSLRIDAESLKDGDSMQQLFELRGLLEIDAAGLAAERRSSEQLTELKATLEQMHRAKGDSTAEIETDIVFHQIIATATNNPYIVNFVSYISGQIRATIRTAQNNYAGDLYQVTLREHDGIYAAINDRSVERARKAMRQHILGASARMNIAIPDREP